MIRQSKSSGLTHILRKRQKNRNNRDNCTEKRQGYGVKTVSLPFIPADPESKNAPCSGAFLRQFYGAGVSQKCTETTSDTARNGRSGTVLIVPVITA